jgi:hypothetical protein
MNCILLHLCSCLVGVECLSLPPWHTARVTA